MRDIKTDPSFSRTSLSTFRYALGLFVLLLGLPLAVVAEDLQVDAFFVSGVTEVAYLPGVDSPQLDVHLEASAACVEGGGFPFFFALPAPSFDAKLVLLSSVGGVAHSSLPVGFMAVASESVRRRATGVLGACSAGIPASFPASQSFDLASVPGFDAFIADAHVLGADVHLRVDLDTADTIPEIDETNNFAVDMGNPAILYPLTGTLYFGAISVPLDGHDIDPSSCSSGQAAVLNVSGTWLPGSEGLWSPVNLSLPVAQCLSLIQNGGFFDLSALASLSVPLVAGSLNGLTVRVEDNLLGPAGAVAGTLYAELPAGLTHHGDDGAGRPLARGRRWLQLSTLTPAVTHDYALLQASGASGFLHSLSVPLSYELASLSLDASSMAGEFSKVVYQYDYPAGPGDPRGRTGVTSNDRRMSLPEFGPFAYSIKPSGLVTQLDFRTGGGLGHFPQTYTVWQAFSLQLEGGAVVDGNALTHETYSFLQSPDCAGCDAGSVGAAFSTGSSSLSLGADGTSVAALPQLGTDAFWGPWDAVSSRAIFQRNGDAMKPAVMQVPGYQAQATGGNSDVPVVQYLLGARAATLVGMDVLPLVHHSLSSPESRAGNHFMAGLTVGPDLYSSGPHNQPQVGSLGSSLAGDTDLEIGFGGSLAPDYQAVISNLGTKYVIRPGGVTGVLNTDVAPQPEVYGFGLELSRFGIRQVDNEIDDFSWVDGSIHVPGKADFRIVFESLEMDCSGDVGSGIVVREPCDGPLPGANCGETLAAWRAEMEEILGLEFASRGATGGVCEPSTRELKVSSVVGVKALDEPIGLTAYWQPDGEISGTADLHTGAVQIFDGPGEGGAGFPVALAPEASLDWGGPLGQEFGWFTLTGDVGLPFWQSLDAELRFKNDLSDDEIVADQSLVYADSPQCSFPTNIDPNGPGAMDALEAAGDCRPNAEYQWGGTGWEASFPIFYETGRHAEGEVPRFLGVRSEGDLVIMSAYAGTDFVTPEQTQISFGASADFDKLRDLADLVDLHVDLNDPESVRKVDFFLRDVLGVSFSGDCGPVCEVVGEIKDKLNLLNHVADAGIDGFIEEGVRLAVAELLDTLQAELANASLPGIDVALGAVDALPEQLATLIVGALEVELSKMLTPLNADLEGQLLAFYNQYVDAFAKGVAILNANPVPTPIGDPNLLQEIAEAREKLQEIRQALGAVHSAGMELERLLGSDPDTGLRRLVETIRSEKDAIFLKADAALVEAEQALNAAVDFGSCGPENPVLGKLYEVKDRIVEVQQTLATLDLLGGLSLVANLAGVDISALTQAQQTIRELAQDSQVRVQELENRLAGLCGGSPLAGAQALIAELRSEATQMKNELDAVLNRLDGTSLAGEGYLGEAAEKAQDSLALLSDLAQRIQLFLDFADELAEGGMELLAPRHVYLDQPEGIDLSQLAGWQAWLDLQVRDALDGNGPIPPGLGWGTAPESFLVFLSSALASPVDELIDRVAQETSGAIAALSNLVPHPDLDGLEDELVVLIMNSSVVAGLQDAVYAMTSELTEDLNAVGLAAFDQVNEVIQEILQGANAAINAAFAAANAAMEGWDLAAAEMDGYALITGDELSKLHVGAEFALGRDENAFGFKAALDVTSWDANGKESGCGIDPGSGSLLDVVISTYDLPLSLGESEVLISKLYLGFTIQDVVPVGLFGGVFTSGEIGFSEFAIYDAGLTLGAGAYENYLGARAGAKFDAVSMQVAFLVGRTCNQEVIVSLDPQVGEFLTFPDAGFAGLFVRGSANIPVWHNGCALTVGVGADAGTWILGPAPVTVGMLVGGAVYGEGACLVSVRGQITILAEVSGIESLAPAALVELVPDNVKLQGEAFFVGGIGFDCDPGTWTSVPRSRKDDWCGTGDLYTKASFDGEFHLEKPKLSAIH